MVARQKELPCEECKILFTRRRTRECARLFPRLLNSNGQQHARTFHSSPILFYNVTRLPTDLPLTPRVALKTIEVVQRPSLSVQVTKPSFRYECRIEGFISREPIHPSHANLSFSGLTPLFNRNDILRATIAAAFQQGLFEFLFRQ